MARQEAKQEAQVQLIAKAGDVEQPFVAAAQELIQKDKEAGRSWLAELRERSAQRLKVSGLPHRRLEAWRYTDMRAQLKRDFKRAPAQVDSAMQKPSEAIAAVFSDGVYQPQYSSLSELPGGVEVVSLRDIEGDPPSWIEQHLSRALDEDERALIALNTALMEEGLLIRVAEGVIIDQPIYICHDMTNGGVQAHVRISIILNKSARATIVERFSNSAAETTFNNSVTTLDVGEDAELCHYKHQTEGEHALHAQTIRANVQAGAKLDSFYLTTGTGFSRTDGIYELAGEGADLRVSGAYMLSKAQHADISTEIIHAKPKCTSREVFHGALLDRSHGIFQGRILVAEDAQKTDGHQMNRTLLLSERAKADAKPELEIYADDVKCSHGATTGELDEDALFYLRSRGLPLAEAKALLVEAFINEAIDEVQDDDVKATFKEAASMWAAQFPAVGVERGQ